MANTLTTTTYQEQGAIHKFKGIEVRNNVPLSSTWYST